MIRFGCKQAIKISILANLVSTFLGISIAWLAMLGVEYATTQGGPGGTDTVVRKFRAAVLQSAWLTPCDNDLYWMVPTAAAVLCVLFFLISVWSEYLAAKMILGNERRRDASSWAWKANAVSYGLAAAASLVWLIVSVVQNKRP